MTIGNLKFEPHFEVLYPLWVVDNLRTLKVYHCLSLVTIGYHWLPLATIDLVVIIGNLKFESYLEVLYPLWVADSLRTLKVHHGLSLVTFDCP